MKVILLVLIATISQTTMANPWKKSEITLLKFEKREKINKIMLKCADSNCETRNLIEVNHLHEKIVLREFRSNEEMLSELRYLHKEIKNMTFKRRVYFELTRRSTDCIVYTIACAPLVPFAFVGDIAKAPFVAAYHGYRKLSMKLATYSFKSRMRLLLEKSKRYKPLRTRSIVIYKEFKFIFTRDRG